MSLHRHRIADALTCVDLRQERHGWLNGNSCLKIVDGMLSLLPGPSALWRVLVREVLVEQVTHGVTSQSPGVRTSGT
jgi:hypothetical protein